MAGSVRTYAFINAKLRARISKLIPDPLFERMGGARSLVEALSILADTPYGALPLIYEKTGDLKLGELELFKQEVGLYRELEKYLRGEVLDFLHALALRYEVDTLKNALRLFFDRKIRGRPVEDAVPYIYREAILNDIPVDALINADSMEEALRALEKTPYHQIVAAGGSSIEEEKSLFGLELALDRFYYQNLIQVARQLGQLDMRITMRLIGVEIDLQNVGWLLRFRSFFELPLEKILSLLIPGGVNLKQDALREAYASQNAAGLLQAMVGSTYPGLTSLLSAQASDGHSRLILIERVLEQIMVYEVRRMLMGNPFTIGILLAYFILKRNEMKKVQMILNAKQYRIPPERMKELL